MKGCQPSRLAERAGDFGGEADVRDLASEPLARRLLHQQVAVVSGEAHRNARRTITSLGEDEYFVMGWMQFAGQRGCGTAKYPDRIACRSIWTSNPGRVPGRFLLGRAFFVYWPAGFSPVAPMPSLAPNFGEMRFIR